MIQHIMHIQTICSKEIGDEETYFGCFFSYEYSMGELSLIWSSGLVVGTCAEELHKKSKPFV